MTMPTIVECCLDGLSETLRSALSGSDNRVREQYCLQRCGLCFRESFVVVDGRVVRASDTDELAEKLASDGVLEGGPAR